MTTLREAAQQVLAQLEVNRTNFRKGPSKSICKMLAGGNDDVIDALRAALAEPVQEPVQHKHEWFSTGGMAPGQMRCIHCGKWSHDESIAPPQRLPLTEEEIYAEWIKLDGEASALFKRVLRKFARAIEAKHGITGDSK